MGAGVIQPFPVRRRKQPRNRPRSVRIKLNLFPGRAKNLEQYRIMRELSRRSFDRHQLGPVVVHEQDRHRGGVQCPAQLHSERSGHATDTLRRPVSLLEAGECLCLVGWLEKKPPIDGSEQMLPKGQCRQAHRGKRERSGGSKAFEIFRNG